MPPGGMRAWMPRRWPRARTRCGPGRGPPAGPVARAQAAARDANAQRPPPATVRTAPGPGGNSRRGRRSCSAGPPPGRWPAIGPCGKRPGSAAARPASPSSRTRRSLRESSCSSRQRSGSAASARTAAARPVRSNRNDAPAPAALAQRLGRALAGPATSSAPASLRSSQVAWD